MDILKVFIGMDTRNPIDFTVLQHSIHRNSSKPVAVIPILLEKLPMTRRGLTDFTYSRYLVPWLCDFKGKAVFLDSDMVVVSDICQLVEAAGDEPVSVVKNAQRFEWPSLMVFNCEHEDCKTLTPEWLDDIENKPQSFEWASEVGDLPEEWNYCIGYDDPEKGDKAKILHYTMGTPAFVEIVEAGIGGEYAWMFNERSAMGKCSWLALHGNSVHAPKIIERLRNVRKIQ